MSCWSGSLFKTLNLTGVYKSESRLCASQERGTISFSMWRFLHFFQGIWKARGDFERILKIQRNHRNLSSLKKLVTELWHLTLWRTLHGIQRKSQEITCLYQIETPQITTVYFDCPKWNKRVYERAHFTDKTKTASNDFTIKKKLCPSIR